MAGDWLQIDLDLPEKPQTQRICDLTDMETHAVCGWLLLFWRWVDRHSDGEFIPLVTSKSLVRAVGATEEFWAAMAEVGWLVLEDGGIRIPDWDKRFSQSSKKRVLGAKRAAKFRAEQDGNAGVTQERYESNALALPKEELLKNRTKEELSIKESPYGDSCPEPSGESSGPPEAPVLIFPVKPGKRGGQTTWPLMQAKLDEYAESFPGLDVLDACRGARQWCIDNKAKRKTPSGMPAFLTRWLTRENNLRLSARDGPRGGRQRQRTIIDAGALLGVSEQ